MIAYSTQSPATGSKQKLALVITSLGGGGAERVAQNLLSEFHNLYDVHLFVLYNLVEYELPPDIKITCLAQKNYGNVLNILMLPILAMRLRKHLKALGISLAFSLLERSNYINCLQTYFSSTHRAIITCHGSLVHFYKRNTLGGTLGRFLIKNLYARAEAVFPCSKWLSYELQSEFKLKHHRIEAIYNPINEKMMERFLAQEPSIVLDHAELNFCTIGSFQYIKNHDLLLRSFAHSLQGKRAKLHLCGQGALRKDLETLALQLQIADQVIFHGFMTNPFALLKQCDALVLTSYSEGLPNVLIESLYCGVPVISVDCSSGPREILAPATPFDKRLQGDEWEETPCGYLVANHNKELLASRFADAYCDRASLDAKKAECKKYAQAFLMPSILNQWRQVFVSSK
jgi:N-acetylgalactosamine-N,N'-diacetylbacillosaminyl-diphospho-undecaprenol 4-alpha-N-acetylgalactosaminyltransferase